MDSFPQSGENYQKAIDALTERFGNKDLLIEVYVRELLKMVINNVNQKDKMPVSKMYDKLETQLRALESMNIKLTKNSAWLYPLVESSLPEEILRAWQRSHLCSESGYESHLENLMKFLKNEVKGEERMILAKSGFTESKPKDCNRNKNDNSGKKMWPTAAGLLNNENAGCTFCGKNHENKDSVKAQSMSFDSRKAEVQKSGSCFKCLKRGHLSKKCTAYVKCMVCGNSHLTLMCSKLSQQTANDKTENGQKITANVTMANSFCSADVLLQTVILNVVGANSKKKVRALVDSGSQRSYILDRTAKQLGLVPKSEMRLAQCLFGGKITSLERHFNYDLIIENIDASKQLEIGCLNQNIICGNIPRVNNPQVFNELKQKKIFVHDVGSNCPEVELLIGSDVYGKLITGEIEQLNCGLTAINTIFGWTLTGEETADMESEAVSMLEIHNLFNNLSISDLWKLETIGINDPVETRNKFDLQEEVKKHFIENVTRDEKGRYCVSLPWIDRVWELPTNRCIAENRLYNTMRKLGESGFFESYNDVFNEWLANGYIEEVEPEKENDKCHFLPHRAIVKLNSVTTKIRPVFDASCKVKNFPSLNDCLQKGPNLIELIPSLLLKFREKEIGVIADIKKAFLQIEIKESDRPFLRFLWYEEGSK